MLNGDSGLLKGLVLKTDVGGCFPKASFVVVDVKIDGILGNAPLMEKAEGWPAVGCAVLNVDGCGDWLKALVLRAAGFFPNVVVALKLKGVFDVCWPKGDV